MQPLTFQDLANNQTCTFIRELDLGLQDVCIGIRHNDQFRSIYSMNGSATIATSIDGEYLRRSCTLVKAGEILHIDPLDYPEICL